MGFIIRWLRKLRRKYFPPEFKGARYLRIAYKQFFKIFARLYRQGVPVDIGGYGYFQIEPSLVFGHFNYEEWGTSMNNGFKAWVEACKGKSVVFDIGAHIGLYSLPVSKYLHSKGRLYAFEPGEKNCAVFQKHLQYNNIKNIQLIPCLVGESVKQDVLFFEHMGEVDDMNSVVIKKNFDRYTKTFKEQLSLDYFCVEHAIVPEVIKIDVEGYDLRVLKGARTVLKKYHPLIFLSVHPTQIELLGDSTKELRDLITELGYMVQNINGDKVDEFKIEEYILKPA